MNSKLAKVSSLAVATGAFFTGLKSKVLAAWDPFSVINSLNTTENQTVDQLIQKGLNLAIGGAALVAVAMLIFAGFTYITANGDENKVTKATSTLTFAIVGLVICFIAALVVNFVLAELIGVKEAK